MIDSLSITAVAIPCQSIDTFGVPIYRLGNEYFTHILTVDGKVSGFERTHPSPDVMVTVKDDRVCHVGDDIIYAFVTADGLASVGTRQEMKQYLSPLLEKYMAKPFLLREIALLIQDSELAERATSMISSLLPPKATEASNNCVDIPADTINIQHIGNIPNVRTVTVHKPPQWLEPLTVSLTDVINDLLFSPETPPQYAIDFTTLAPYLWHNQTKLPGPANLFDTPYTERFLSASARVSAIPSLMKIVLTAPTLWEVLDSLAHKVWVLIKMSMPFKYESGRGLFAWDKEMASGIRETIYAEQEWQEMGNNDCLILKLFESSDPTRNARMIIDSDYIDIFDSESAKYFKDARKSREQVMSVLNYLHRAGSQGTGRTKEYRRFHQSIDAANLSLAAHLQSSELTGGKCLRYVTSPLLSRQFTRVSTNIWGLYCATIILSDEMNEKSTSTAAVHSLQTHLEKMREVVADGERQSLSAAQSDYLDHLRTLFMFGEIKIPPQKFEAPQDKTPECALWSTDKWQNWSQQNINSLRTLAEKIWGRHRTSMMVVRDADLGIPPTITSNIEQVLELVNE